MPSNALSYSTYNPNNHEYAYIFDQFGTIYSAGDVMQQKGGQNEVICYGSQFDVTFYFEDDTGVGFNDATLGATRRDILCQAFNDVSQLIDTPLDVCSNSGTSTPNLLIRIESINDANQNALAFATNLHYNFAQNLEGVVYNSVWRYLNGGTDPLVFPFYNGGIDASFVHGILTFNFAHPYYYGTATPPVDQYDFYTATLHEVMHLLGIYSMIQSDGTGQLWGNSTYTKYDLFLSTQNTNSFLLNNNTGCYDVSFNPSLLSNLGTPGCDNLIFNGDALTPADAIDVPTVFPISGFVIGSSLSHFLSNCSPNSVPHFLMHPSLAPGTAIRSPTPEEVSVLCHLGYQTTGTYGSGENPTTYNTCGNILAAVDDPCQGYYTVDACDGNLLHIPISEIIGNDHGVVSIDCVEVEKGNGTATVTVTDVNGCTASSTKTVVVNAAPTASISGATTVCLGQTVTLTANGGGNYNWSTLQTTQSITVSPTIATTYTVTVTDVNGCTATNATIVTVQACTPLNCIANTTYLNFNGSPNYTAPVGTTTWTTAANPFGAGLGTAANPVRINGDVTLPAGADITIQGMLFEFGPNGRIVVLRGISPMLGGTLRLDGCTLTGNPICNTMWQGIQIQGPGFNVAQDGYNAGRIETVSSNNTEIEHAVIAVANTVLPLFDFATVTQQLVQFSMAQTNNIGINLSSATLLPNLLSATALANSGGRIRIITGSLGNTHLNISSCFYGVYAGAYAPLGELINLRAIRFQTAASLRYPFIGFTTESGVVGHLLLNTRIMVRDSEFNNLIYGVRLNGSPNAAIDPNTFNNCKHGVSARNFSFLPQATTQITGNTFNLNQIAIQGDGIITDIIKNQINGDNNLPTSFNTLDIGILLRSSDFMVGGATIQDGNIISNTNLGIIIANSDQNGNEVRNNTINNSHAAILVADRNNSLQLACNNLNNYVTAGIGVIGWTPTNTDDDGVIPQQGDCIQSESFNPAANNFQTVFSPVADILRALNDSQPFEYYDIASVIANLTANDPSILQVCNAPTPSFWTREGYCGYPKINTREEALAATNEDLKNMLANNVLRQYRADSNYVAATQFLEELQNRLAKRLLVADYYAKEDANTADTKLESIERQTQEDNDFYTFYKILIGLKQSSKSLFELNTNQEQTLLDIANHRTNTAYKAQTLLYLLRGYEFPVEIPNIEGGSMAYTVFKTGYNNSKSKFGTFIPNPSSGTTSLQYYLVDDTSTAILQIYDLNGHCVTSATLKNSGNYVLDATLPTGIYMYTISVQGNIVERNKLAIIK